MGGFNHVAVEVIIGEHRAAHGSDADGLVLQAHDVYKRQ